MTDRSDHLRAADEALRLRLFDEPQAEAEASPEALVETFDCDSEFLASDEAFEGELPDDLLMLAERLASEAQSLAKTYPAGAAERLPIGDVTLAATALVSEIASPAKPVVEAHDEVAPRSGRRFGVGMAAAVGFAAIIGAAIYSATAGGIRDSIAQIRLPGRDQPRGIDASPSLDKGTRRGIVAVPVRTVSLSLADDGDYRRLESLLRDRSEPEREAMFDLLNIEGGGEETAVRISF